MKWDPSVPLRVRPLAVCVVVSWAVAAIGCAFCVIPFIQSTNMNLDPPPGSKSEKAEDALDRYFPALQTQSQLALLVTVKQGNLLTPNSSALAEVTRWMRHVNNTVVSYSDHPLAPSVMGCCIVDPASVVPPELPIITPAMVKSFLHGKFISQDGTATIVLITLATPHADDSGDQSLNDFIQFVRDHVIHAPWQLPEDKYDIGFTGLDVMNLEMVEGAIADLERMDIITIPLAFAVLAYFLRSGRLMIIPGCTVLTSMVAAFAVLYPISKHMNFMTTDPSVIMSNALAFCIDYNLFLCMRFLEGVRARQPLYENVTKMLKYTAVHCIGVSGSLITLAYLGLLFIPSEPLQAIGIAGGLTIACVVLVNTTLTPCLFLCFGDFFRVSAASDWRRMKRRFKRCRARCCADEDRVALLDSDGETETVVTSSEWMPDTEASPSSSPQNRGHLQFQGPESLTQPVWHKVARRGTPSAARLGSVGVLSERRTTVLGVTVDADETTELRDLFDAFDEDGDGFVTAAEFCDVMKAAGEHLRLSDAESMLKAIEPRHANKMDYKEFCALLELLRMAKEKVLLERQSKSLWFRITKTMQKMPILVVLIVIAAGSPFWIRVKDVSTSIDLFQFIPRNSDSVHAFKNVEAKFLPGEVQPFYIVVENITDFPAPAGPFSPDHSGVLTQSGFDLMNEICTRVQNETALRDWPGDHAAYSYFTAPVWFPTPGVPLHISLDNFTTVLTLVELLCASPLPEQQAKCKQVRQAIGTVMESNHTAAMIQVATPFNAMGSQATRFIKDVRRVLESYDRDDVKLYLGSAGQSAAVVLQDYNDVVDEVMPLMLGVILGVVAVIIALIFRSVLVSARLILTVCYTVAVTFGVAYYVFQTTAFEWLFPFLTDFKGDALSWFVPPLAVSITMALGLDYDIFLLVRIVELREFGYSDPAAILKGVYKSGGIISGAGIIMAIAFGGLMASQMEALNQFGVILVVSVLLDTFVIRTMFVPAAMFLLGRWNWWPRKMPQPTLDETDFLEEVEHLTPLDLIEDGASTVSDWGRSQSAVAAP
eukprot:TRINITY_DN43154_c0_g1_i1.p1 TRINITY_DN43154_c0_g1~~TRINITY_DN43154_c0_g1_i1.p1  ORF type:complete len:1076 (+),score=413.39 TRINITY_DN43154_c0_g1_i1:79-3228(+)